MRALGAILNAVLIIAYPIAIWWGLSHFSARGVALMALAFLVPALLLRFRSTERKNLLAVARVPLIAMSVLLVAALFDDERLVLATPVIMSTVLLVVFGRTLFSPPSMIETFARLKHPDLSPQKVTHCRQATVAWCVFFVVNGAVAGSFAVLEMRDAWVLYTGLIAYILMGLLFAGEYVVRHFRFGGTES